MKIYRLLARNEIKYSYSDAQKMFFGHVEVVLGKNEEKFLMTLEELDSVLDSSLIFIIESDDGVESRAAEVAKAQKWIKLKSCANCSKVEQSHSEYMHCVCKTRYCSRNASGRTGVHIRLLAQRGK